MNLPKYTKEIDRWLLIKSETNETKKIIKKQKPGISKRIPAKKKITRNSPPTITIDRMRRKLWENEQKKDPYTDEEENEIFLEMYRNKEVRKYCEQSMIYFDTKLPTYIEISTTLNSFREIYNGFYRWTDTKFLARLYAKWKIIDTVQDNHIKKLFEQNEKIKENLENYSLLDKSKVDIIEDNEEIQNESTKKATEITPISPDLENYSLLDKNKVENIEKQTKEHNI